MQSSGSFLPFGRVKVASKSFKSCGKSTPGMSRPRSHFSPTVGFDSGLPTKTSNGLPLTGRPRFLTSIKCFPGSSGVNSNPKLLSGVHVHSSGSFLPFGRVNVASKSFRSRGKSTPGMSRPRSHFSPTVGFDSGLPTKTSNGLPLTGRPRLVTSIKCFPGSFGVNSNPRVFSGVQVHSIGSFSPFGRVRVAFKSFKSRGKSKSGISRPISHFCPTVGFDSADGASATIISNGLPLTGLRFFLTSSKCLPASSGVKFKDNPPFGAISHLTISILPDGRVNSAFNLSKSSGSCISSISRLTSQGAPTVGFPASSSGKSGALSKSGALCAIISSSTGT